MERIGIEDGALHIGGVLRGGTSTYNPRVGWLTHLKQMTMT